MNRLQKLGIVVASPLFFLSAVLYIHIMITVPPINVMMPATFFAEILIVIGSLIIWGFYRFSEKKFISLSNPIHPDHPVRWDAL